MALTILTIFSIIFNKIGSLNQRSWLYIIISILKALIMKFRNKIIVFAIIGIVLYFLLSYHFIIIENGVKLLKKSSLTLEYTIYSAKGKTNAMILSIDELREDGIGDLLVEMGKMSEQELELLMLKYEKEDY